MSELPILFEFAPDIQAGLASGLYKQVTSKTTGELLSMVRHATGPQNGQIAAHAIGVATRAAGSGASALNPLVAMPQLVMGAGSQINQGPMIANGIKLLSSSVATLQATTAVIGVGVAVTGVLGAVSLWQTLKLRQDVKEMKVGMQEGFLNLHEAFASQGEELLEHIDQVAADVEFGSHRTILVRAYGHFDKALNRLRTTLTLQNNQYRGDEISAARGMLFAALADYDNDQLMAGVCPAGFLRRRECVWAIEQAIAMTYQMQGEFSAVSDRLDALEQTIRQDSLHVVSQIKDIDALDFFFPEIHRISGHDLPAISTWCEHAKWHQSLSADELKEINELPARLKAAEFEKASFVKKSDQEFEDVLAIPAEYQLYEEAQEISHFSALKDSLSILIDNERREQYEKKIISQSRSAGLSSFTEKSLRAADPLTLANLAYYF